jgi:hypothetical protein
MSFTFFGASSLISSTLADFSDSLDCLIPCGLVSTSAFAPPCPDRSFQLPALFLLFQKHLPNYKLMGDVLASLFQPHQSQAFRIKFNHSVCRHSSSIPVCPLYVPTIDIVFVSVMYILYELPTWLVEYPIMMIFCSIVLSLICFLSNLMNLSHPNSARFSYIIRY